MATKLIAYDLNSPGQDYRQLVEAIKQLGPWWHNLDSTWLVKCALSTSQVRDLLKDNLDDGDELLVVSVTGDARAWSGFSSSGSKWLKETWD